jgi:internalin A
MGYKEVIESAIEKRSTRIDLRGHQLDHLPARIFELSDLQELDLRENSFESFPEQVTKLKKLMILRLGGNHISEIPESIGQAHSLEAVDLSRNNIQEMPLVLSSLPRLSWLDLGNNSIAVIPNWINEHKELRTLYLNGNCIESIPQTIIEIPKLFTLHLEDNPIRSIPVEIANQGFAALVNYFTTLSESHHERLFEAKLIIVGEGEVGKTCLASKLVDPDFNITTANDVMNTTEGIEISRWEIKTDYESDRQDFRINIWDFGGQEIYHATHQFFLTKRSLYIFVWDARKEDRLGGFYYWLNIASLLSGGSPVLIVLNKSDERIREIDEASLVERFRNIRGFYKVSCLTGMGLCSLTNTNA